MQNLAVPRSLHGCFHGTIRLSITGSCFERSMLSLRAAERLFVFLHEKNITFGAGRDWTELSHSLSLHVLRSFINFHTQWPWGSRWIMNALDTKKRKQSWRSCCRFGLNAPRQPYLKTLHPRTFVESSICSRPWWYKDGHAPSFWQSP